MRKTIILATALLLLPSIVNAQTENPRGIYRMMSLKGNMGEVKAPYDQYKICTDSITLMLTMQRSNLFSVINNEKNVLNYTGEQPKDENDKSTLVYDSNSQHFSLKWWSTYKHHMHFPEDDWCIENYEADNYSDEARPVFEALTATPAVRPENPLLGEWRVLGYMDELKGFKKQLVTLKENYENSKYAGQFLFISPTHIVAVKMARETLGNIKPCECNNKNTIKEGDNVYTVKWLSKDVVALEERIDYRIDWQILERVTDGQSLMGKIASLHIAR